MMKRQALKKYIRPGISLLLIAALILGSILMQQRTTPANPLNQAADSMLLLSAEGKTVSITQEIEEPPKEEEQEEPPEEEEEKPLEEEQKPPEEQQEDEPEEKPIDDPSVGTEEEEGTGDDGGGDPSDGGDEGNEPGPGPTNIVYFTTTIKDGETITTKAYQFSISHKLPELEPQSTQIYINGQLTEDVKDARTDFSIFLNEGENTVRVQVSYKNEIGQIISPYKDYLINVDTRSLVINTSLQNGMTVDSPYLAFTASAEFGQDPVDLVADLDGEELAQFDGIYEAYLQEGENLITLYAEYGEHQVTEQYLIYYEPPEGLYIDTDLEDQMVIRAETGEFTFRAEALGGGPRTEFTVTLNGKRIEGENGTYNVNLLPATELSGQNNIIKMVAEDDEQKESLRFRVKFIPIATPETEPEIVHINISDGQTIKKKNPFTLELAAQDYKGNKIYFDGIEVRLNGKKLILQDTKPYITYKLNFNDGANLVQVTVTDDDGRYKEFEYNVIYEQPDENQKIGTVTVIMDANVLGKGTLMETSVDLMATDNLAAVILRALDKKGFGCQYEGSVEEGFYLAHIEKSGIGMRYAIPDALRQELNDYGIAWQGSEEDPERAMDSLGQFDYTTKSGWMILVDGSFITEGASAVDISDGAIVKIRFTLAGGMDIGGYVQGDTFENTY